MRRVVDVFEAMLRGALDSLNRGDRKRVAETACIDTVLDRLDTAIKEYLTSIDTDSHDDNDHRRLSEILVFTTNLEHAGDIAEKSLMPLAAKRIKRGVKLSEAGRDEIRDMIERLTSNARAAAAVFMTEGPRAARQLLPRRRCFFVGSPASCAKGIRPPDWKEAIVMSVSAMLFSFTGRINRATFGLAGTAATIVTGLIVLGIAFATRRIVLALPVLLAMSWITFALAIKRLHDRNKSKWWILLFWFAAPILAAT